MSIIRKFLFVLLGAALTAVVLSGCSTQPEDWSVEVNFTSGTKGTAKVKVQNINTSNFLNSANCKLDRLDIYYAYSSLEKIDKLKSPDGKQSGGAGNGPTFSSLTENDVDGIISVTITDEENAAFKADPKDTWEKLIDFELPPDAAGKETWFRVVAFGTDYDTSSMAGARKGYCFSSNYSNYTPPLTDPDPTYTITIPATVNIDGGTAEFKAEDVTLPEGKKINITVDGENTESGQTTFNAKNEAKDSTVQYTIKNGSADVADGGTALTFTGNGTQTLTFAKKADSTPTYAGTHTETLTFGVSVAEYVPSLADAFEDGALINVTLSVHGTKRTTYSFKNENGTFTPTDTFNSINRQRVGLKKDDSGSLVVEASGYTEYSLQTARSDNCLCIYTFDTQSNKYSYVKQANVIDEAEFVSISVNGVDIPVTQA